MAENKITNERYYWLKLKRDFFKRHDVKVIEGMENGKDYVLFYLKLLCESVDHNGNLRFSDTIPYSESMLASVTNTNIDVVRSAMKILISLNLVEILDDQTIFMNEVEKMTGSETASTIRSRECRARQAEYDLLQCNSAQQIATQENRDKNKIYNTHTARARARDKFFREFSIRKDSQVPDWWDWEALTDAYTKSKKLLQSTPAAKCTSWITTKYDSILAGKYEDREEKHCANIETNGRYSADELNALVICCDAEDG